MATVIFLAVDGILVNAASVPVLVATVPSFTKEPPPLEPLPPEPLPPEPLVAVCLMI